MLNFESTVIFSLQITLKSKMVKLDTWIQFYKTPADNVSTIDHPAQTYWCYLVMRRKDIKYEQRLKLRFHLYMFHWGRHLHSTESFWPKNLSQEDYSRLNPPNLKTNLPKLKKGSLSPSHIRQQSSPSATRRGGQWPVA